MVDLVVVKFNGSKNQSIRGKSWASLLTFQGCLFSIPDFSHNNEHWQYTLELMDRTVTKYVKFDGKLCNTGKKSS
jgi:hypothetical protein